MAEELSYQEQREIVADLTTIFNVLVNAGLEAQNDACNGNSRRATRGELLREAVFTLSRVVDFQSGSSMKMHIPSAYPLASAELAAIGFVEEINLERKLEDIPGFIDNKKRPNDPPYVATDVIPALYYAMENAAVENNIPFQPLHRPKTPTP